MTNAMAPKMTNIVAPKMTNTVAPQMTNTVAHQMSLLKEDVFRGSPPHHEGRSIFPGHRYGQVTEDKVLAYRSFVFAPPGQ